MINLIKLYKGIKSRYTIHRILMGSKLSNFNFSSGYTLDISSEKHTSYENEWNIELKNLIISGRFIYKLPKSFLSLTCSNSSEFKCLY